MISPTSGKSQGCDPSKSKNSKIEDYTAANKITIAKNGEAAYIKDMDLDEDGKITLQEFKEYCDKHSISEGDRENMLQSMMKARLISRIEKEEDEEKKTKEDDDNDKSIYAKKSDENYDENMDLDNDGKVTYKEYMKYCIENAVQEGNKTSNTQSSIVKKAINAYTNRGYFVPDIKVESEA